MRRRGCRLVDAATARGGGGRHLVRVGRVWVGSWAIRRWREMAKWENGVGAKIEIALSRVRLAGG
jgi:hypothetical protein